MLEGTPEGLRSPRKRCGGGRAGGLPVRPGGGCFEWQRARGLWGSPCRPERRCSGTQRCGSQRPGRRRQELPSSAGPGLQHGPARGAGGAGPDRGRGARARSGGRGPRAKAGAEAPLPAAGAFVSGRSGAARAFRRGACAAGPGTPTRAPCRGARAVGGLGAPYRARGRAGRARARARAGRARGPRRGRGRRRAAGTEGGVCAWLRLAALRPTAKPPLPAAAPRSASALALLSLPAGNSR